MHKHIPLLCSTPVVESLIAKSKRQTRRTKGLDLVNSETEFEFSRIHNGVAKFTEKYNAINEQYIKCPYGNVGDVIWVREEHKISYLPKTKEWLIEYKDGFLKTYYYKKLSIALNRKLQKRKTLGKWQRARFLPKELSRLFLKVKSITVERLNEISEADAIAEGIQEVLPYLNEWECYYCRGIGHTGANNLCEDGFYRSPIASFKSLWESINGKDSWNTNPWVWVIEFEQIEKPDGFV